VKTTEVIQKKDRTKTEEAVVEKKSDEKTSTDPKRKESSENELDKDFILDLKTLLGGDLFDSPKGK
jgi:hypothetical protein